MAQDYDGADVLDSADEHIGSVERTYVDDSGEARFVEVKLGTLFAKHRLVPVDGSHMTEGKVKVPYSKDLVENSPNASSSEDTLQGTLLDHVRAYYEDRPGGAARHGDGGEVTTISAGETATTSVPAEETPQGTGQVRDLGDVIEIPVIEEELVKRPVVKEVLRIQKSQVAEPQTILADVRQEDIEVMKDGDAVVRQDGETGT